MSELRELYQTTILDHNRRPRNFRALQDANREADGYNPLCGDKVHVQLRVEDGVVREVAFQGAGCAISTASASLMTEAVKGRPVEDAMKLFDAFHELVTGDPRREPALDGLGKLAVFAGVREYPVRVKCATLPWHTLRAAVEQRDGVAKTE
jgi:nitrogen fixation NifU-like protein